jgi:hypothetical protein
VSWVYVPGSVDSSLGFELLSGDPFEPSVSSNGTLEPQPLSWHGWRRRPWLRLLYGTTCAPSTADRGAAEWISSQPVIPASRSPRPGSDSERTTLDTSGRRSGGSSRRPRLPSPSSRTSEDTSDWASIESSWTSPISGSMRSGRFSERATSEHRTAEIGSGSSHGGATWDRNEYPTPTAASYGTSQNEGQVPHKRPTNGTPSLETWARSGAAPTGGSWPTPRAMTGGPESAERKKELGRTNSGGGDLQAAAILWPTPTAGDSKASGSRNAEGSSANQGVSLTDAIRTGDSSGRRDRSTERPGDESTPTLNPLFVEWLMGVPRGWTTATVSGCSATELSRWRRLMRSELSRAEQGSPSLP